MAGVRTGSRKLMRQLNTSLVLNAIRETDCISSVDITRQTRLSAGTVASVVKELSGRGYVEKIGQGESSVGRKPILLRFNPEAGYVISAGMFGDETQLAILDLAGHIKDQTAYPTRPSPQPEAVFGNFACRANRFLQAGGIGREKVLGAAIALEGMPDPATGTLLSSVAFGWRDVPVRDHVQRELGIRTWVDSDGACMALGECRYGAGRGATDLTVLDVDAGIGTVAICDGRIWRGAHNMAGEVGHTLMVPEGPVCRCGRRGCLEAVASASAIVAHMARGLADGRRSTVAEDVHSPSTRQAVRAVFNAARGGDPFAVEVVREAGHYLGLAVAAIINSSDPERVILTGCAVDESQGMLSDIIRSVAPRYVVDSEFRKVRIEEGTLGKDAVLIGAATVVYQHIFETPLG